MLGVLYEDEAMAGGGLQAGDAGHGDGVVSEETAAELLGEIAQGLLHGCLLSLSEGDEYNAEGTGEDAVAVRPAPKECCVRTRSSLRDLNHAVHFPSAEALG